MTQDHAPEAVWRKILALTAAIRDKTTVGEWETITALDTERRAHLENFFSTPPEGELARRVSEDILGILESDRQVMEIARQMRTRFGEELHRLRMGHQAVGAYLDQIGE